MKLTPYPSRFVKAPGIEESPVSLECKVVQVLELGTHDMFIAKVLSTNVDDTYLDENGKLDLKKAELIAYNHGEYYELGKLLGTFGYSVRKKKKKKRKKQTF
jgi:flavin reductase (DIM6/NTAB) family NADH-FMN oxidoreductase RutF